MPADRLGPRIRLKESLDDIFAEKIRPEIHLDAVESKLFGIGSEAYVVGSHEFYMGYAVQNGTLLCLDAGHFHPTEGIAGKLSALSLFTSGLPLHVSRPMRWDSDHVVILQWIASGDFADIREARSVIRASFPVTIYEPEANSAAAWEEAYGRCVALWESGAAS